jgi:hypothetical protein
MRTVTALKDLSQPHDDTPPIPNALHGHAMVEQVTRTGITRSYTQKLWMRVRRKAAYLPG